MSARSIVELRLGNLTRMCSSVVSALILCGVADAAVLAADGKPLPAAINSAPVSDVFGRHPQNASADTLYYSEPDKLSSSPSIIVARPSLQALVTIEKTLDPFRLDATRSRDISFSDVIDTALRRNLTIQISREDLQVSKYRLLGAYSQFLPDAQLGYNWNRIRGHLRLPFLPSAGSGPLRINTQFILAKAAVRYKVFEGGRILFNALQNRNNFRATRWRYRATTNDVLLESANRYYDLLLNEALLQVRIQAVRTSEEQLRTNTELERNGLATRLDVLQSRTQLADDTQNLIEQQVQRRISAIRLAEYLDLDSSVDLEPTACVVEPVRLISDEIMPGKLLGAAMDNRPELKAFREQALAARNGIGVATAPLLPTVELSATEYGIGDTLTNKKRTVVSSAGALSGMGASAASTIPMISRQSRQITGLGVLSVNVNWTLAGFGTTDYANIQAARAQARQAVLQSNQESNTVISEVRQSYLNQLNSLRRSEQDEIRVESSIEELRLSQLRLQSGLGKNIDVLRAQQDLTNALVQRAQSTIEFNKAQVKLLHDLGLISRERILAPSPLVVN